MTSPFGVFAVNQKAADKDVAEPKLPEATVDAESSPVEGHSIADPLPPAACETAAGTDTGQQSEHSDEALHIETSVRPDLPVTIRVDGVHKVYEMYARPIDRLKQMFVGPHRKLHKAFSATRDISFEVRRGETVGIVGRNGSGKSTLLQMICGTLRPTQGAIMVDGRIAALLELGAGFNPEFTGRENVMLNGAILGLTQKQMLERFDSIAEFAEIGDFMELPVKTYSSGMYVRLAFATAINADPDVLVVDEALSVGDEAFRRKCFARIEQIKNNGATILFVSHSAQSIVQLCDRAILLDKGELILEGKPKTVIMQYQRLLNSKGDKAQKVLSEIGQLQAIPEDQREEETEMDAELPASQEGYDPNFKSKSITRYQSNGGTIRDFGVFNTHGDQVNILESGRTYRFRFSVDFEQDFDAVAFGMLIKTVKGVELCGSTTLNRKELHLTGIREGDEVVVEFEFAAKLKCSTYFINAGVLDTNAEAGEFIHRILDAVAVHVAPIDMPTATGHIDIDIKPSARVAHRDVQEST